MYGYYRSMKLIEILEERGTYKNGKTYKQGRFLCGYCGNIVVKRLYDGLKYFGCGCARPTGVNNSAYKHGFSGAKGTIEFTLWEVWRGMKARCYNKNHVRYARYGGRGITVCDEWKDNFKAFLEWCKDKYQPGLTIDRIDGSKGYSPSNCRFVTYAENNFNKEVAIKTRAKIPQMQQLIDEGKSWKQIAKICDVGRGTIGRYMRKGLLKRPNIT